MGVAGCQWTPPPPLQPVKLKQDTPQEAAMTYAQAIGAGDIAAARASSLGDDKQKRWTVATATLVDGLLHFDAALYACFSANAASTHMDLLNAMNGLTFDPQNAISNSTPRIDGDRADLVANAKMYGPKLRHVAKLKLVQGKWFVDLPRLLAEDADLAAENDSPQVQNALRAGKIMSKTAEDVRKKKFPTVEAANDALAERLGATAPNAQ